MNISRTIIPNLLKPRLCNGISTYFNVFLKNFSTDGDVSSEYCGRSHTCGDLRPSHVDLKVTLFGWLQFKRLSGRFLTLRDSHGTTQISIEENSELSRKCKDLAHETVLKVEGIVIKRPSSQCNMAMNTGDIEVLADEITIVNSCEKNLPFQLHENNKVKEDLRLKYRYLDLRHSELQKNLKLRSKIIMQMRKFLCDKHDFVEVETPTLFRKTPGGAREFIVPTHIPNAFYALPQSPQQFKQLLMVGGIDRYMQIARCYRDETAKPDRQPEFTQLDIEMSFVNEEDIKCMVEALIADLWHLTSHGASTLNSESNQTNDSDISFTKPFPRMKYYDAIKDYGVDKPDTRFGIKLKDITEIFTKTEFAPFKQALSTKSHTIQAINFKNASTFLTGKDLEIISSLAQEYKKLDSNLWSGVIKVKEDGHWSPKSLKDKISSGAGSEDVNDLEKVMNFEQGDLMVIACGDYTSATSLLGKSRLLIADLLEQGHGQIIRTPKAFNFLWVEDFPLFLPREDGVPGLESAHHPFTSPKPYHKHLVYSDPQNVISEHYDLVLNGSEIGGGSIRIHDAKLQKYILSEILKEDVTSLEHLLQALEFGAPSHGGIAFGLDRFIAMLCNATNIREVIAFPKSSEGKDLMSKSPASISKSDQVYYHMK